MDTIDKIFKLIKENGITASKLSTDLNLSSGITSQWKSRKQMPSISHLLKISDYFDVSVDYLLGKSENKKATDIIDGAITNIVRVPIYGRVSAGNGCCAMDDIEGYELMPSDIVNGEKHFCLKVKGDSMFPKIEEGDSVLVQKQSTVDSGDIAVVLIDDEDGVVKKVVYDKNKITLISFNPYYPERVFQGEEVLRCRVIGKVKRVIKYL